VSRRGARDARTDVELMLVVQAQRGGEHHAFTELVRRYGQRLLSLAYLMVAPPYAEDLVQVTLARAWRYANSYRGGDVWGWFAAIMRRASTSRELRPSNLRPEEILEAADASDDIERLLDAQAVESALSRLDPLDAMVIRMRLLQEMSWKQIGEQLDIRSRYLVQRRFKRAMSQLRALLLEGL